MGRFYNIFRMISQSKNNKLQKCVWGAMILFNYYNVANTIFNYYNVANTIFNYYNVANTIFNYYNVANTIFNYYNVANTIFNYYNVANTIFNYYNVANTIFNYYNVANTIFNYYNVANNIFNYYNVANTIFNYYFLSQYSINYYYLSNYSPRLLLFKLPKSVVNNKTPYLLEGLQNSRSRNRMNISHIRPITDIVHPAGVLGDNGLTNVRKLPIVEAQLLQRSKWTECWILLQVTNV